MMWIARDFDGGLSLYTCKPEELGGCFYVHDGSARIDYGTRYAAGGI